MDALQVLFVCSDFAVRQILARKLFLCRLAIPFILPYTHQLLLWPLRSIVLEWRDRDECKGEALVKCKLNMVAFMRFGAQSDSNRFGVNSVSKSSLLNHVLSESGHDTFFHRGSPCGGEKRATSDGMVEMSHFLPAANQHEAIKQAALFFNLRGDACSHDVPRQVLLKLATVLVLVLDISQLHHTNVQDMFKETVAEKRESIVLVLTDNDGHDESEIEGIRERFNKLLAKDIDNIDTVQTFDEHQNATSLIEEVREAVSMKMTKQPSVSLEEHVTSQLPESCEIDENTNKYCSKGKELAESVLKDLSQVDKYEQVKNTFLPMQGECLHELSKALRNLNRTSRKEEVTVNIRTKKECIQKEIESIREKQHRATGQKYFIKKLITMLHEDCETREFAVRWVQLRLDELSMLHLPGMHKEKNVCWRELTDERSKGDSKKISQLEDKLQRLHDKIASATCGWEHLMRELGQMYEASLNGRTTRESSFMPDVVGRQLFYGHPVELMDGDHGIVPIAWIKAVFQSLAKLAGDKKILVLSVLGIQSSGKSTLLNTMFGLEFAVSAGRCTRGIYAQLLPVKDSDQRFDYLLVLDSEGLRSQQRQTKYEFDNELATLVIGLSDIAMINTKGANITEMADVLEIVVHAFLRMKLADCPQKRQCMFVHQNVAAVNAQEKLADERQMLQEKLDAMTKEASEALGLPEAITSFNRIINFDSQQNVVYFPDLWSGDPPMAVINEGYSRQAAITQCTILQRFTRHFNSFINMEDFVVRTEDMWNGVLSDDFIFSFRNTLAAKAYIDVEKEVARLTLAAGKELQEWVSSLCEPTIRNCITEQDLKNQWEIIEETRPTIITTNIEDKKRKLLEFFEKHNARDIIEQWRTETIQSLQSFGKKLGVEINTILRNSKSRKSVRLRTNSDFPARQAEIQRKAIDHAKKLQGKQHSPDVIVQKFDDLWRNWVTDLTSGCKDIEVKVLPTFNTILWEMCPTNENQFLWEQLKLTPLEPDSKAAFTIQEIQAVHIFGKDKPNLREKIEKLLMISSRSGKENALQIANNIMSQIGRKIDALSDEEVATNTAMHGKEILDEVWRAVEEHNKLPYQQTSFALTPQFKAMVAVRASCVAVKRFETMSARYEEQHGVQAQVAEYKQRIFVLFKSSMEQASADITAAEYMLAVLAIKVENQVTNSVKTDLGEKIRLCLGTTKRDFIIAILEELMEDYDSLHEYVKNPAKYAAQWLKRYVEKHLFKREGETNYSKYASYECRRIVDAIKTSMVKASADIQPGSSKYKQWLEDFCRHVKDTVFISPSQLQVDEISSVQDLVNFQSLLTSGLEKSQDEMLGGFLQKNGVFWLGRQSTKIFNEWWGCTADCPFCREPCQFQTHTGCHKCIQHRPQAVRGTFWDENDNLVEDACDASVTTATRFDCQCKSECKEKSHPFKDYKKYLPKWDITPNPAGDGSKYWQWVMARFHRELGNSYPGKTLKLPDSWKKITAEEAKASLRKW